MRNLLLFTLCLLGLSGSLLADIPDDIVLLEHPTNFVVYMAEGPQRQVLNVGGYRITQSSVEFFRIQPTGVEKNPQLFPIMIIPLERIHYLVNREEEANAR